MIRRVIFEIRVDIIQRPVEQLKIVNMVKNDLQNRIEQLQDFEARKQ